MALVLVIDDDVMMRNLMTRLVESMGHEVLSAADGYEGLGLFDRFRPELVLTDLFMPTIGGNELIPRLRVLQPAIKIIAVSGGAVTGSQDEADRLAVDGVLGKPFRVGEFIAAVGELLAAPPAA